MQHGVTSYEEIIHMFGHMHSLDLEYGVSILHTHSAWRFFDNGARFQVAPSSDYTLPEHGTAVV